MTEKNELNFEAIPLGILEDAVVEPVSSTDEYTNIIANVPLRRARSRHMRTANQEKIQFGIRVSVSTW